MCESVFWFMPPQHVPVCVCVLAMCQSATSICVCPPATFSHLDVLTFTLQLHPQPLKELPHLTD